MLRQQGFTLIEVLVASLVIILGLMSVVNMQLASQKKSI
ncbi:MAG: prepilin-type N-terminal cleavage/methylation domain-containing protein [Pseudomonadaceae bacterium]|nr:prepilin-type N-terminal cleavage/methylation domain-containing protein [Pseudomonadaceae bacterium]